MAAQKGALCSCNEPTNRGGTYFISTENQAQLRNVMHVQRNSSQKHAQLVD